MRENGVTMPLDEVPVRVALAAAFPALPVGSCRFVGEGWDSSVWGVDGALLFRFPKRPEVARALAREIALLPLLAPRLPLPIPRFSHLAPAGAPTDPALPFVGYPPLPGVPLDAAPGWPDPPASLLAALGRFLRALHDFPVARAVAAGVPLNDRAAWRAAWADRMARILARPASFADAAARGRFTELRAAFLAELDREGCPFVLTHHDFAPEHVLATPDGTRLAGIIDWGDVSIGDPALDFAGLARDERDPRLLTMLDAYGAADPGFARRAAWYARLAPCHTFLFGLDTGDAAKVREGATALAALIAAPPAH